MKRRTTLATLTFLSGLVAVVIAFFLLVGSATPVQADPSTPCAASGGDCDGVSFYSRTLVSELSVGNDVGITMCTQLLNAGGFEGNPERVFPPWVAGATESAWQRTGYLQYEGAFSMRLHASLGSYLTGCPAFDPWFYQTVRIPVGISATTRITVEGYYAVGGSLSECSIPNSTDADDVLYVYLLDGIGNSISDPITITHGGVATETWEHFSVDFTDDVDLESLAGQDVQVRFFAVHDGDEYGTWFYLDNLEFNVCPYQPSPELIISKTGPSKVKPGELVTCTLTITNHGFVTATNVIITDVVPSGADVVGPVPGGTVDLPVVIWAIDELAPNGAAVSVQFAVTATQTITNSDYRTSCAEGVSATGTTMVVTNVGRYSIYLPMVLRQFP